MATSNLSPVRSACRPPCRQKHDRNGSECWSLLGRYREKDGELQAAVPRAPEMVLGKSAPRWLWGSQPDRLWVSVLPRTWWSMPTHECVEPHRRVMELRKGWELTAQADIAQSHIHPWANPDLLPLSIPALKGQPGNTAVSAAGRQKCTI